MPTENFALTAGTATVFGEFSEKLNKNKKSAALATTPLALILSACGGSSSSTSSNVLSLTKSGSTYSASSVTGFTVNDSSTAKFDVADATSNAYEIKLDATGTGVLEFDFADANDTVTLAAGSKTSGFTTLKVTDGTVDATNADLTGITRVEVASGIKISLAQIKTIPTIVANSATSQISVEVTSEAEATELVSLISAGTVKVYGDTNPIKLVAAPAATVTAETLTAKETETTSSVKAKSEAPADTSTTDTTTTTTTTGGGGGGGTALTTFSSANVSGDVTFSGSATGDITASYDSATKAVQFSRESVNDMSTPLLSTISKITIASSETLTSTVADHNTITGTATLAGGGKYKFSDAGTATGVAGVAEYILANGTNDFTLAASQTQKVTGGTGADTITLTAGTHTIVGGGTGTDTLKIAQASSASTIADGAALDLSNTSQQTWSGSNKVTMSGVEDIDASGQLNTAVGLTLTGSTGANSLTGGSGNDTLIGGAGADTLNGGVGTGDVVSYADVTAASAAQHGIADASIKGVAINLSASAVTGTTINSALSGTVYIGGGADATTQGADLAAGTAGYIVGAGNATGGGVRDTITNTEGAVGSARNDYIALGAGGMSATAGDGDDVVVGGGGDDTVIGGAGADTLNGGAGTGDVLSYADVTAASAAQHGIADTGILGMFVNVSGGTVTRATMHAAMQAAGTDNYHTASDADVANGKVAYIAAANNTTGADKLDTVSNFESIIGSARADFIALGSGGLTVDGGAGIDVIVNNGAGVDTIKGGAGNDVFVYASSATFIPASGDDAVIDSIDGGDGTGDVIQIAGAIGIGAAGTDTLARVTNTEILKAAANADGSNDYAHAITLKSDAALSSIRTFDLSADVDVDATTAITLTGVTQGVTIKTAAAGASTIVGSAGVDTITGGAKIDTITGGGGADIIDLASDSVIDKIVFSAAGDFGDVVSNFAIGTGAGKDDIELAAALGDASGALTFRTAVALSTDEAGTLTALTTDAGTDGNYIVEFTGSTIDATLLGKIDAALAAGSAATGKTFILIDNGTDSALLYDADASDADVDVQLVCLLSGVTDITGGTDVVLA